MDEEFVIKRLDEINEIDIEFSKHAADNFTIRGFEKRDIINILKGTKGIVNIEYQPDDEKGRKYKVKFAKSHKYNFVVVINILNGKIRVVTFHLESAKRMKGVKKWLERK